MNAEFRRRRDAFCPALNNIPGWHCELPGGAFYAFANVKARKLSGVLLEYGRESSARRQIDLLLDTADNVLQDTEKQYFNAHRHP